MFTGLIEELGTVVDLTSCGTSLCLKIKAEEIFRNGMVGDGFSAKTPQNGPKIGDSIAVNGVCLTATNVEPPFFEVTAVEETLRKTTLGSLTIGREHTDGTAVGARINLEQAATIETRLGGHLVQGHVDTTARLVAIRTIRTDERSSVDSWEFDFEIPAAFAKYIVPKGSIALDGISLTIARVMQTEVCTTTTVAIIPHTYFHTDLQFLDVGGTVNVEFDILAKMVEQFVKPYVQ